MSNLDFRFDCNTDPILTSCIEEQILAQLPDSGALIVNPQKIGNDIYATIQGAVDVAEALSVSTSNPVLILIAAGLYTEDVTISSPGITISSFSPTCINDSTSTTIVTGNFTFNAPGNLVGFSIVGSIITGAALAPIAPSTVATICLRDMSVIPPDLTTRAIDLRLGTSGVLNCEQCVLQGLVGGLFGEIGATNSMFCENSSLSGGTLTITTLAVATPFNLHYCRAFGLTVDITSTRVGTIVDLEFDDLNGVVFNFLDVTAAQTLSIFSSTIASGVWATYGGGAVKTILFGNVHSNTPGLLTPTTSVPSGFSFAPTSDLSL